MADAAETAAREAVKKSTDAKAKAVAEADARQRGTPTPTQEENDLAMHGVTTLHHADDGSGPEVQLTRTVEPAARPAAASYQTRTSRPAS
jgi:hypothetical protein